jgi:hypothetical protein
MNAVRIDTHKDARLARATSENDNVSSKGFFLRSVLSGGCGEPQYFRGSAGVAREQIELNALEIFDWNRHLLLF